MRHLHRRDECLEVAHLQLCVLDVVVKMLERELQLDDPTLLCHHLPSAYIVIAYIVMAYIVMAYIVMAAKTSASVPAECLAPVGDTDVRTVGDAIASSRLSLPAVLAAARDGAGRDLSLKSMKSVNERPMIRCCN